MSRARIFLALIASLLFFFFTAPQTQGKIQGVHTLDIQVSASTWASTINSATGTSVNLPYTITWTGNIKKQYALISLINSGTVLLHSGQISFSSVKSNGDPTNPPTMTFDLCSGTWNSTTFACSGTITTLLTATSGVADIPSTLLPGERVIIRLTNLRDVTSNYVTTFDALTNRSNIRAPLVVSS